jgi:hypothetical protein
MLFGMSLMLRYGRIYHSCLDVVAIKTISGSMYTAGLVIYDWKNHEAKIPHVGFEPEKT